MCVLEFVSLNIYIEQNQQRISFHSNWNLALFVWFFLSLYVGVCVRLCRCVSARVRLLLSKLFTWLTLYMRWHYLCLYCQCFVAVFVYVLLCECSLCVIISFVWRYFGLSWVLIRYAECFEFATGERDIEWKSKEKQHQQQKQKEKKNKYTIIFSTPDFHNQWILKLSYNFEMSTKRRSPAQLPNWDTYANESI